MILLIGPGAVGTILATHLVQAGREALTLYVRERSLSRLHGITQLRMTYSDPTHPPMVVPRPPLTSTLDLTSVNYVLLCVKFPDLDALLDQLPPIPPHCTLVSTLNGVAALRRLRERLPQTRILPMTIMYNGQLPEPLHARLTTRAEIILGNGGDVRLRAAFEGSGMKVKTAAGDTAVWGKLLINLANAIGALTHSTFRDLLTDADLRRIFVATMDEAVVLLRHANIPYQSPAPMPHSVYRQLLLRGGPLPWWFAKLKNGLEDGAYPSMVSDIQAGRLTEVAQLNGEIIRLAQNPGTSAPINAQLTALVTAMQGKLPPPTLTASELRRQLKL